MFDYNVCTNEINFSIIKLPWQSSVICRQHDTLMKALICFQHIVSSPVGYRGDAMRYCYSTMKTSLYKFRKTHFLNISCNMVRESWEGNENLVWLSSVSDSNWQYTWLFTKNWQSQTEMLLVPGLWPLNTFCCNIFTQLSINDHTIGYSTQQVVQNFTTRPCLPCFWC